MKTKTIPADPCKWLDDAVEKATRWRNLYFTTDGKSTYGTMVHPSCEAAKKQSDSATAHAMRLIAKGPKVRMTSDRKMLWDNLSHVLQIPVASE